MAEVMETAGVQAGGQLIQNAATAPEAVDRRVAAQQIEREASLEVYFTPAEAVMNGIISVMVMEAVRGRVQEGKPVLQVEQEGERFGFAARIVAALRSYNGRFLPEKRQAIYHNLMARFEAGKARARYIALTTRPKNT